MTTFVDTNIIVRHLTGDPPEMAAHASAFLAQSHDLLLPDLILAEIVYVLESFYEVPIERVASMARSVLAFEAVHAINPALLHRAIEVYEVHRIDFAEAYLVANAEITGVGDIASFDGSIDRVPTVRRIEP